MMLIMFRLKTDDIAPRNLKGWTGSLFDNCVNAMRRRPYWPSRMEVSYCTFGHRRRNFWKWGRGQIFGSQKWRVSAGLRACATQGSVWGGMRPLRSWSFFENVGSNEAIWCTIFHHVKHLTACLLRFFFLKTLEQDGQKSGGAIPPVWKVEGPLAP